jgi:cytosine/adenosine deaminase-related metal-dependent hydrolase
MITTVISIYQPAHADLVIAGETIERLGQNLPADHGMDVIDATGKLVVPGFLNAHYHSHDVMARISS